MRRVLIWMVCVCLMGCCSFDALCFEREEIPPDVDAKARGLLSEKNQLISEMLEVQHDLDNTLAQLEIASIPQEEDALNQEVIRLKYRIKAYESRIQAIQWFLSGLRKYRYPDDNHFGGIISRDPTHELRTRDPNREIKSLDL